MKENRIVVTGGSGMVGMSLKKIIPNAIYLSSKDYDLTSENDVIQMYKDHQPEVIIHLAGKVGGIMEHINKPAEYFTENILINTLIVKYARINGVKRFIGMLSTCIYPDTTDTYPMTEDILHQGPPTPTIFSYGYAKRSLAVQIDACNKQYNTKYQYLIPCNLYGEYDKFGEKSHLIAAIIEKIHQAKTIGDDKITLFGTGTSLRQSMYSGDLAKIIKKCIDENVYDSFNVAIEHNLTIDEIAKIATKACGVSKMRIEYDNTKPDGQYRKDVSIEKMKRIFPDFKPTPLHQGIKHTYSLLLETWE